MDLLEEKKDEVVEWLLKFKRLPSSRFVGLLGLEYKKVREVLLDLETRGVIRKEVETNATYWVLVGEEDGSREKIQGSV